MKHPWRWAFIVYAPALVIATHWPKLEVHGPVERTDLWIHVAAFGLWTVLIYASGLLGARREWKSVALTAIIALAWAATDEWTQQFFQRITAADDFAADVAGVWIGVVIAAVWCTKTQSTKHTAQKQRRSHELPLPPGEGGRAAAGRGARP